MPGTKGFELIDGLLVEMPPVSTEASWIAGQVLLAVGSYVKSHRLGWVFDAESEYNCFPNRPNHIRKCDVSFIRYGRFKDERLPEGRTRIAPDLAVEVISPSNTPEEIETKIDEYLGAGIRLIWVVYPKPRTVYAYRPDGRVIRLNDSQELSGEDVVPGFTCRIADLFPPPVPSPAS
jgi:Uma2 family endonuclease